MNRTYFKGIALVAVLAFLLTTTILVQAAPLGQDEGNVYEVIQGNDDLSTLAEAIEAAGLGETLSGEGPFTVFAPSNAAFEAIPADELDALLADAAMLSDLLLLHVVPGDLMAADLAGQSPVSALGDSLEIAGEGDDVTVNGATVVAADIAASNGVVHVIDSVLGVAAEEEMTEEETADTAEADATAAEDAPDEVAEDASEDEANVEDEAAEPVADAVADAVADEVVEDGNGEASSEGDDATEPVMESVVAMEVNEATGNVAERSGRPRSQYMKVWRGVNHPRTICR